MGRTIGGLRGRLLRAFLFVAVPPTLVLAVVANALVSRRFEETAARRLHDGREAARAEIERVRTRAADQVAAIAQSDLPSWSASEAGDLELARALAERRDLAVFDLVDEQGRVVSSRHWPAGIGLPSRDRPLGDDAFRVVTVPQGYGLGERLAITAAQSSRWRGAPVTVRGGAFVDEDFLVGLSRLMGMAVGIYDAAGRRWFAAAGSPLGAWTGPALDAGRGDVRLEDATFRWTAMPLRPGLWLVAAMPRTPLDAVTGEVRQATLVLAAVATAVALLSAVVLSGRIARPALRLAEGARQVAAGDLTGSVEARGADEIAELARAFNAMTAELRDSRDRLVQMERVAAWREMARRLAHELKNPLFPIQLSIETLRRAYDTERDFAALFRDSSDTILEELQALRKIIDEFSEFARMPRPELRPTDVNAVVEQVLALYQARAAGYTVETQLARPLPAIAADRALLSRAIGNLVANALEAMPGSGTLRLRTAARDGAVAVEIEDTGPGLDEDQRTRLFTPYFTTKRGGTGLGLAIVQGIVSDHGGRVEVRSAPGAGTTFTLLLPANERGGIREKL